jgi:hypothetical protein
MDGLPGGFLTGVQRSRVVGTGAILGNGIMGELRLAGWLTPASPRGPGKRIGHVLQEQRPVYGDVNAISDLTMRSQRWVQSEEMWKKRSVDNV